MKKIVIILVMVLFTINLSFAQDSLQTELDEFKKFVHYCKIHNTEIVNIDPIAIEDVIKKVPSKKIDKLLSEFYKSVEKIFFYTLNVTHKERFYVQGKFINLAYQVSPSELYFVSILENSEMLFYKTTKNEFNRLLDRDLSMIGKYHNNSEVEELYSSEKTFKKVLLYMIEMNRKSHIYTID